MLIRVRKIRERHKTENSLTITSHEEREFIEFELESPNATPQGSFNV